MTDTTRRGFLGYGLAGAVLSVAAARPGAAAAAVTAHSGGRAVRLRPFVEPLPLPGAGIVVATPAAPDRYHFTLRQIRRRLHPQLPEDARSGRTTTAPGWAARPARSAWPSRRRPGRR